MGDRLPWPYDAYAWTALEERLGYWLGEVKSYIETPDLWDELRREREMLQAAPAEAVENWPFTPEEQAEIVKRLREIEEYAKKTYALSDSDRQALEARFDYLEEAVGRLGRSIGATSRSEHCSPWPRRRSSRQKPYATFY